MPLVISGKLSLPVTGRPAANAEIRFRAVNSVGEIIQGAESLDRCDASGNYNISLGFARYELATKISTVDFIVHGQVTIDIDTVAADLESLIEQIGLAGELTDELIKEFQQLKAETVTSANEASKSASEAAADAKVASDAQIAVTPMYNYFNANYPTFETNYQDFAVKYPDVVQKHAEVVTLEGQTQVAKDLAEKWASNPENVPVTGSEYSAFHWAEKAKYNANQTFVSGGLFTPAAGNEYPDVSGISRDTIWIMEFSTHGETYTFTSGQLSGKVTGNGDMLFYDTPNNVWSLIPTAVAAGVISVDGNTGPNVNLESKYYWSGNKPAIADVTGLQSELNTKATEAYVGDKIKSDLPIYTGIVYKASGGNSAVENMIAGNPVSLSEGDIAVTIGDHDLVWTISSSNTHDRKVEALDNGLFALLNQNKDSVVNFSYFSFVYGDDDTALNQAIKWTSDTKGKLRASKKDSITISALPTEQIESGADIDLCGAVINTTITSSNRGDGVFMPRGTVSSVIFATLTQDVQPFVVEYKVDNPANFSKGDFVTGSYTVDQDNQTFPTGGGDYEFLAQVLDVTVDSVVLDLPRSYVVDSTPPAGGSFILSKAEPVTNFKLKGFTVKDANSDSAVNHSAFAPYLCADFEVSDVRGTDSRGSTVYYQYCHNYVSIQIENISPSFTGSGRGYTEQHIAGSMGESIRTLGNGVRHVVDYSNGSCQMTTERGKGTNCKDGMFGCHGSYENNLRFINCEGYSANVPMFYLATSGTQFGRNCSDIKIDTPTGRNLGRLIYSGAIDARVNRCELINPNYRDHIGTSPAVSMNMTRFSIENGLIEGGLIINPSLQVDGVVTDLTIKGTTILPLGDQLIQISNMFGKKVIFLGADVSGELSPTAVDANFVFDGGTYRYASPNLMNPAALNNKLDSLKMDSVTIEVPSGINVSDSIKSKSFSWQGNTIEIESGQTAMTEFDCTNTGGISISDNDGDMRYTVRRFKELIFDSNRQVNPVDEFLNVIQSTDARLVITSNNMKKASANAKCIDIIGGGQTGLNIVCNSNTHNGIIDFAQGSGSVTTGGVATGNAYVPDSGDTNTQTLPGTLTAGANFGYV